MAYGLFRQLFGTGVSISLHMPIPTGKISANIGCQFRFPLDDYRHSSLFQFTISGNACYDEIFNVTVSDWNN
jgi:hypothetical protein